MRRAKVRLGLPDAIHFALECELVQFVDWQTLENVQARLDLPAYLGEGMAHLCIAAIDRRRILKFPVRRGRPASQNGQISPAALSQTVIAKSMCGASSAKWLTSPMGSLPAEQVLKRPRPATLSIASAMMLRAQFPVHRNSTL